MSDDRRKTNKQSTGTVPKVKCRNNTNYPNERESPRSWTNNLAVDFTRLNVSDYLRNSRRNIPPQYPNFCTMNTALEDQRSLNQTINGSITPNTSSSTSRRNSGTVPKCDNVTKCPDKKQIEDKLSQIREYLQITSSLMSSMKNTDDQSRDADEKANLQQMISDLKDSEAKLVDILANYDNLDDDNGDEQIVANGVDSYPEASNSLRNELEDKIDHTNREMELLRDQQQTLMSLQQKAENKMKDARQIQEKLLMAQFGNDLNSVQNQRDKNLTNVQDFDAMIKDLDERSKRLNEPRGSNASSNLQDKLLAEVDSLQNQIINLHSVNEDRNQLIQVLDNRDMELRAQHLELQSKLSELQTRKQQVDQLVDQLQNMDEDGDDDDVGVQVRRIVTMKDQLSKLKDMLEIVKTTENVMQNSSGSQEEHDLACAICTKAENFLQKDGSGEKSRTPVQNQQQHEQNVSRYDNTAVLNENRHKQVNKNSVASTSDRQSYGGAKPRNKLAIQAELEAKKRELEDIMGKHKAGTSNLNHDVGTSDNKSEFSCSTHAFFDGSDHNRFDSSDRYSSDDCPDDVNGYSDLSSHNHSFTLPVLNYPQHQQQQQQQHQQRISKLEKCQSDHLHHHHPSAHTDYVHIQQDSDRLSSIGRTPERNTRSSNNSTVGATVATSEHNQSKNQLKKQLELIRSVCDSMLDQQQSNNVQLMRNNLTPSPLYSEPRHFASPNPHAMNAIVNPIVDSPWSGHPDPSYQGWMATNNLQTQAFMLNTLNQCCQMLWLQQRELINLRQTVSQIQERVDNNGVQQQFDLASPINGERSSRSNQKINQVPAACSMPNLNQYNLQTPSACYQNNTNSGRLLDPGLNNMATDHQQHHHHQHINNSVLHAVNANINPMPGQIWNGQALNNQVAPGNRANNYWDNFRSYSRQNLLSTKSNEGLQNISSAAASGAVGEQQQQQQQQRANNSLDRSNPFALLSIAKGNSEQTSSSSAENTPRRTQFIPRRNFQHRNNSQTVVPPPDVLNVNVSKTSNDNSIELITNRNLNETETGFHFTHHNSNNNSNAFGFNETNSSNNSNIIEEHRNQWHEERQTKSKLFEELRENVYKEVVTLISANEARPHFLIQLFRDLQMISSDPLRLKILQSIQTIITHSIVTSNPVNLQVVEPQSGEQMLSEAGFSLQSTVWSKLPKNPPSLSMNSLHLETSEINEMHNVVKELIPYLNDHEDDVMTHPFLSTLKQVLIESEIFRETVRDSVFKKHFINVLDELLLQYVGKKVRDVKMHVMQTINDLLKGELSFIQLIQDTCPENCTESNELLSNSGGFQMFDSPPSHLLVETGQQLQNGDLAEADQGRVEEDGAEEEEEEEEEGAVGGFWDLQLEPTVVVNSEEVDIAGIDFQNNTETQFIKQGLDQVPTRLPTKSRSNTPSKDRSSSSRSEHSEQF